jgi:hypothetical protein
MNEPVDILAIIAARNEADVIRQTVEDLVAQGIRVHVLDDGSDDGTDLAIRDLIERGALTYEPLSEPHDAGRHQYSLERILARKAEIASESSHSWIINHDADELRESPWSDKTLREGIELVDSFQYNAIDFEVLHFRPTHNRWTAASDLRTTFTYFERGLAFDKLQIKCWKAPKGGKVDLLSSGGHEARFEGRRVFPIRFLLRHYPVRSQAQGVAKILNERLPRFAPRERARGWHVQYDNIGAAPLFIRSPETLTRFHPAKERLELQVRNRVVEALEYELSEARTTLADTRTREDQVTRDLEAMKVRLNDAEQQLTASSSRELQLQQAFNDERRRSQDTASVVRSQRGEIERLVAALDAEREALKQLDRELRAIRTSWTWRLTAPARRLLKPFME